MIDLATATKANTQGEPLCVDLDGTLIHSNLLFECLASIATRKPWLLLWVPVWLAGGRAKLKMEAARHAEIDVAHLPYDERVVAYLREARAKGRQIVLATAAAVPLARAVANHLGLFDAVMATEGDANLKGPAKAAALEARFGRFAYIGNDRDDIAVWDRARAVGIANAAPALRRQVIAKRPVEVEFAPRADFVASVIKALRPYQWSKNLLVFVPILTANQLLNAAAWETALVVFCAFSAAASGIYVINDLSDLTSDRKHPRKRFRPFASGALSIPGGVILAALALALGVSLAATGGVLGLIALYAAASLGYSLRFKEFPLIDVFILAFLYVVQLVAGGIATGFVVSLWLLGFSAFLFLGLAFVKRAAELSAMPASRQRLSRRDYSLDDLPTLKIMGIASSFAASVLLCLYVQSPEVAARYAAPIFLWGLVPLTLFWQCRLWLSTARGYMHDDPIVYSARDWVSWVASVIATGLLLAAGQPVLKF